MTTPLSLPTYSPASSHAPHLSITPIHRIPHFYRDPRSTSHRNDSAVVAARPSSLRSDHYHQYYQLQQQQHQQQSEAIQVLNPIKHHTFVDLPAVVSYPTPVSQCSSSRSDRGDASNDKRSSWCWSLSDPASVTLAAAAPALANDDQYLDSFQGALIPSLGSS